MEDNVNSDIYGRALEKQKKSLANFSKYEKGHALFQSYS